MMHGLVGEQTLLRIIVTASDRVDGRPVHEALVECLRSHDIAGATVLPAIMGFGARGFLASTFTEIGTTALPVIIEAVDREASIARVLPALDRLIPGGIVTLERAQVIAYRPHSER